MKLKILVMVFMMAFGCSTVIAQETVETLVLASGSKVVLYDDGTWKTLDSALPVTGFNPNAARFYVDRITKATPLKVYAKLATHVASGSFRIEENKYYSFKIECEGFPEGTVINGHIKKDSPEGMKLFDALSDGKKHKLLVKLRFRTRAEQKTNLIKFYGANPPDEILYDKYDVLIAKVINVDSWSDGE